MRPKPVVYSIRSYAYLRDQICASSGFEQGEIEAKNFPDGERYLRIVRSVSGRDVILVGGTPTDTDALEMFDLASAMAKYGAGRLTLVVPYYGYSTMERAVKPGEVVTAKSRARLLSAIPPAARGNRVFLLDLHTEGIAHYFEGHLAPRHISGSPLVRRVAQELAGDDFVIGCTDAGRAKWVELLANQLGVEAAFVYKRRLDGSTTEVVAVSAQVQGRKVVIYDDMIRTGGSLIQAAKAYANAGASEMYAVTTHGVFVKNALERMRNTGLFRRVVCTNSLPGVEKLASEFLQVESVADLLVSELNKP